jgi:Beta-propeller repeat
MAVDGSGNVYVTGFSVVDVNSHYDCVTIKYNSAGQQQWVARYTAPSGYAAGLAIALDGSGNVYVAADAAIPNDPNTRFCVTIKYNAAGDEQWVAVYDGGMNNNGPAAIAVDGATNVYVTGNIQSCPAFDYLTLKYDSAGQERWVARYQGPGTGGDSANAIAVDDSGNVYVTGVSYTSGISSSTIKYNSAGQQQWVARYDQGDYAAHALTINSFSNVYVTGGIAAPNGDSDYGTIKYNSARQQQWLALYDGPSANSYDSANAIAVDGAGNVYVTGRSAGPGIYGYPDYATVKYDSAGQQQWVARYNGPGDTDDQAVAIAVDTLGNVYVTGTSNGDFVTIKYGQGASPTPTVTPTATSTPTPTPSATPTATATPTPTPAATPTPPQCFGQLITILNEDFDGVTPPTLPAGWTATNAIDPDGILWQTSNAGLPSPPADSPPNAAWVNDPAVVSDKYLDSPNLNATESYFVRLTFRHNFNLESGFDGGVLELRNFSG